MRPPSLHLTTTLFHPSYLLPAFLKAKLASVGASYLRGSTVWLCRQESATPAQCLLHCYRRAFWHICNRPGLCQLDCSLRFITRKCIIYLCPLLSQCSEFAEGLARLAQDASQAAGGGTRQRKGRTEWRDGREQFSLWEAWPGGDGGRIRTLGQVLISGPGKGSLNSASWSFTTDFGSTATSEPLWTTWGKGNILLN